MIEQSWEKDWQVASKNVLVNFGVKYFPTKLRCFTMLFSKSSLQLFTRNF